ncbi:MAG: ATP phosphoribosyltransferase regulatory subunit [Acutalibacter sp.]
MRTYSKITPEGARDLLFEECRARREVQAKLSQVFTLRGYREVITPGLEYFDVFNLPGAAIPQQEMYKCTDNHGRLVVFRPDSTLPIARMAASRLQGWERPLRFFYSQTIYRNRPDLSGRSDESAQMGIELMGAGGLRADLEAIATAVEALSACVPDFRVEIGHARFFQALADQLPLSPEEKEGLRDTIESKNYAALSERLDPLGDLPAARAMAQLPRLFGGEEALAGAERWFQDGETREILESLKGLYQALGQLGLGDRLMVDLGLVQRNDYYTGVVFSAYAPAGGRGAGAAGTTASAASSVTPCPPWASPSTGRACGFKRRPGRPAPVEALVYGEPGFEMQGQKLVSSLAGQGVLCESSLFETEAETLEYAKKRNIPTVYVVGENTREITLEGGKR